MLLALERDQFIKLYKFGELIINIDRFLDGVGKESQWFDIPSETLDGIIPIYEQSHEILIINVSKERIVGSGIIGPKLTIKISDLLKIYPLTAEAKRFLNGRFHPKIQIGEPVFERQVFEIQKKREWGLREKAAKSLQAVFDVAGSIADSYKKEIEIGLKDRILGIKSSKDESFLSHIIRFDRNPIFPEGPIEFIFKTALIYTESQGKQESDFRKLPLFKFLETEFDSQSTIMLASMSDFVEHEKTKSFRDRILGIDKQIDLLLVSVYYLFFKSKLNRKQNDLNSIKSDLLELKAHYPNETRLILYMIGMIFSFENLNDSLYEITNPPLFSGEKKLDLLERLKLAEKKLEDALNLTKELEHQKAKLDKVAIEHKNEFENQSILLRKIDEDLFDLIDTNRDGHLEPHELMEFWKKLESARQNKKAAKLPEIKTQIVEGETNIGEIPVPKMEKPNSKSVENNQMMQKELFEDDKPVLEAEVEKRFTNELEKVEYFLQIVENGRFNTPTPFNNAVINLLKGLRTINSFRKKIEPISKNYNLSSDVSFEIEKFLKNLKALPIEKKEN
jgi:hypothetical protein